eukprot:362619-Chlamydomonas_euryale.AAC.9
MSMCFLDAGGAPSSAITDGDVRAAWVMGGHHVGVRPAWLWRPLPTWWVPVPGCRDPGCWDPGGGDHGCLDQSFSRPGLHLAEPIQLWGQGSEGKGGARHQTTCLPHMVGLLPEGMMCRGRPREGEEREMGARRKEDREPAVCCEPAVANRPLRTGCCGQAAADSLEFGILEPETLAPRTWQPRPPSPVAAACAHA